MANYWRKRAYQESATDPGGLAKRGLVYLLSEFFDIGSGDEVFFGLTTSTVEVEFQFYEITSDRGEVKASLLESPTATIFDLVTPRNLNRNFADNATASVGSASAVSGGIVVAEADVCCSTGEYISTNTSVT